MTAHEHAAVATVASRLRWARVAGGAAWLLFALVVLPISGLDVVVGHGARAIRPHEIALARIPPRRPRQTVATGATTTSALLESIRVLLDKRGGYLSNDRLPPGVLMDNMPNWEFGSLTASRDLVRALRNDFSRSQTQSIEDPDLAQADPLLSSPNDRWLFPSSESQYRKGIRHLEAYLGRLERQGSEAPPPSMRVPTISRTTCRSCRAGSAPCRSACRPASGSGGIADDVVARGGCERGRDVAGGWNRAWSRRPGRSIDDNFYEARGYTWTLLEQLKAIQQRLCTDLAQQACGCRSAAGDP